MKLILSLLVMILALGGLIYVLKPEKKKKPNKQIQKKKTATPLPPAKTQKPQAAVIRKDSNPEPPREPTMEEIRFAVRKYVTKFPGVTADLMQDWMKKP